MQKKGVVYRMTMMAGLGIIILQVGYEHFYSHFLKEARNL